MEHSVRLNFNTMNNEAEYEALITGLQRALVCKAEQINIQYDSQLVVNQITGDYQMKEPNLQKYLNTVMFLLNQFKQYNIHHVVREDNRHADALAYLASH